MKKILIHVPIHVCAEVPSRESQLTKLVYNILDVINKLDKHFLDCESIASLSHRPVIKKYIKRLF